ncbi:DegV family protein [Calidifontibacillus oryziterrae]|uniref:DegV family protein n=1 Tax=Calidifontibacillus oryziterrae TaxID=1191699 RepID=UPI0002E06339|nr:DegV family protein [Calidifontibacillus oryziterrae]
MRVKIIADSACDLPQDIIESLHIDFLPLVVQIDEQQYYDGETIQPKELYQMMREGTVAKTSQVPPSRFEETYIKYAESKQPCIYIAFSSELSGTYQTSTLVKTDIIEKYPDFDLTIIDSKCASLGYGLVVKKAAELAEIGKSKEEIIEMVTFYCKHMEHLFTVDSLEYLYRGGRVSKTSAFVGGLLNIKPILNVEDGKLIPLEKLKGRKKVLKRIVKLLKERGYKLDKQCIAISHGDDLETAQYVRDLIKEETGCNDFLIHTIGCSIGAHTGPGTISIFFLNQFPSE